MTREETVALFERCEAARAAALKEGKGADEAHEAAKAIWNAWAEGLLAQKAAMEKAGTWQAEKDWKGDLEAKNDETRAWMAAAQADFSALRLAARALVDAAKPEGGEERDDGAPSAALVKSIVVEGDVISFRGFVFPGDAGFGGAQFSGDAGFGGAQFSGDAGFGEAQFSGDAWFGQATFESLAAFGGAVFEKGADFTAIRADKSAFTLAGARFAQVPDFTQAHFQQPPRFDNMIVAEPLDRANWGTVKVYAKRLDEAEQKAKENAPKKAEQEQGKAKAAAPAKGKRVSNGRPYTPSGLFGLALRRMGVAGDRETSANFRTLKRWAVAGADHENELKFFANEMRARRFWIDSPTSIRHGAARFWLGWLYEKVSDFGRSLTRPLATWIALILVFALFYLLTPAAGSGLLLAGLAPAVLLAVLVPGAVIVALALLLVAVRFSSVPPIDEISAALPSDACASGAPGALESALDLSLKNAFIVLDWQQSDSGRYAIGCLYGFTKTGGSAAGDTLLAVPPFTVSFAAAAQNVLSAALIFLFLLALRNLLRVK